MAGLPQGTVAVEYTIGTGAGFFNNPSTIATTTASADNAGTVTASSGVGATFPTNPTTGQTFFNQTLGKLYTWTGAEWQ